MFKIVFLLAVFFMFTTYACKPGQVDYTSESEVDISSVVDSVSYSIGVNIGLSVRNQGLDSINLDALLHGLTQAAILKKDSFRIEPSYGTAIIRRYLGEQREHLLQKNLEEGRDFLAQNAKKDGIVSLPSGLQYRIIIPGNGSKPVLNDVIRFKYTGKLIDGNIFDTSGNDTIQYEIARMMHGWSEAFQLMPKGAMWEVFIPTELAFGTKVRPDGKVQPNVPVIYQLELIDIVKQE